MAYFSFQQFVIVFGFLVIDITFALSTVSTVHIPRVKWYLASWVAVAGSK